MEKRCGRCGVTVASGSGQAGRWAGLYAMRRRFSPLFGGSLRTGAQASPVREAGLAAAPSRTSRGAAFRGTIVFIRENRVRSAKTPLAGNWAHRCAPRPGGIDSWHRCFHSRIRDCSAKMRPVGAPMVAPLGATPPTTPIGQSRTLGARVRPTSAPIENTMDIQITVVV
jgi:hypothetical protein